MSMQLKFGVFDHMDRGAASIGEQYQSRLKLIEAYDAQGFYAYHLAEHHSTPLGMAPSPSVFLAAVAQRTRQLRFGPLVYTLSVHHPLRVLEEICMLDQLSDGRLEMGFGRGVSPYEVAYYGVDPSQAQSIYHEAYQVIMQGLKEKRVHFQGKHFQFNDVPVVMECVQQPTPPVWYGVGHPDGAKWAADNNVNIVCNGLAKNVRLVTDMYREHWREAGKSAAALPCLGVSRHIVVAESDHEAREIARRAYRPWLEHLFHLWKVHGTRPASLAFPETFDEAQELGLGIAGAPDTVKAWVAAEAERTGINYLVCRLAFGDMTYEESLRSTQLLGEYVLKPYTALAQNTVGN